jgi:hypothetical protein
MTGDLTSLESKYRSAKYWIIDCGDRVEIGIDGQNAELDGFLLRNRAGQWALITAYNPRSETLRPEENDARDDALRHVLESSKRRYVRSCSSSEDETWPVERGFFVFDISSEDAADLGLRFEQNAIVVGVWGGPAHLKMLTNL